MTERECLEKLKQLRSKSSCVIDLTEEQQQEKIDRKKRWVTYFRNNIETYIVKRMGFYSFGYQVFSYHLMNASNQYIEVSTRGVGKSLRATCFASARALLYPGSKIGITAVGASQANENFNTAFMQELIYKKYSPFLAWLYDKGLITTKLTDKGYCVNFWNGSIIYFFACISSSRGLHVDVLIGEEMRLIKKSDWDSIAMPMLVKRRAGFRNKPEYIDRIDLDEETKVLCITSNRFKNEPFNTMYNNTFTNYFKNTIMENRVFSIDIFPAIKHGLKSLAWFNQQKQEMDSVSFNAEILNETIGETENAYFTLEMFQKNQIIQKSFVPPTTEQFINNTVKNRKKDEDEVRLIFIDFAFSNTVKGSSANDNTVIGCMTIRKKGEKWYREVEYLETAGGGEHEYVQRRIREMFWFYKADYIVYDNKSGGTVFYNDLTKEYIHPELPQDMWNSHGFTIANESDYHMMSTQKLDELRMRAVDPQAIPCMIPISADENWNSDMYQDLAKALRNEEIAFLIDDLQFEQDFTGNKKYMNLTSEEKANVKIAYTQTMLMINEAINLSAEWRGGKLKLSEPRSGVKDRIVGLCYGNMVGTKIINRLERNAQQSSEIDWGNMQLVF